MRYVECPDIYKRHNGEKSLFLAGGITGCRDWQSELARLLSETNLAILNPRRKFFPKDDPNIEEEQIGWEYEHLKKANAVSFWFPPETLCPITLYELGKQSASRKKLFLGLHIAYERIRDVEIQTRLIRSDVRIVYSLQNLSEQIREWDSWVK
ncbi:MAG: nucleoside 2-deoxyribosyltransferase domain-containing protein [archaeon]|nr:nucleoside 2-deoxyribosyltransferase domain-containing protein [archaeon]